MENKPLPCRAWFGFCSAVAFLTRVPCSVSSPSPALPWYGLVGLILGAICTAIAAGLQWFIPSPHPALAALAGGWLWVAAEAWLTRGLHWDGVADMGDALGSGTRGEQFWSILKDSRLGAFGAMGLIFILGLQALAIALHLARSPVFPALIPLLLAPAWARLTVIWLAWGAEGAPASSLGTMICSQVRGGTWLWAVAQGAAILCACLPLCSPVALVLLMAAQMGLIAHWRRLARRYGGLSGDFFGCQIELSQAFFLLFTAA